MRRSTGAERSGGTRAVAELENLARAAVEEPDDPVLQWKLGQALAEMGDDGGAERAFLTSLALKESGSARQGLAELYVRQGRKERAELVHLEGLRRTPQDPRKLAAYSVFLAATGRPDEAARFRAASRPRWSSTARPSFP